MSEEQEEQSIVKLEKRSESGYLNPVYELATAVISQAHDDVMYNAWGYQVRKIKGCTMSERFKELEMLKSKNRTRKSKFNPGGSVKNPYRSCFFYMRSDVYYQIRSARDWLQTDNRGLNIYLDILEIEKDYFNYQINKKFRNKDITDSVRAFDAIALAQTYGNDMPSLMLLLSMHHCISSIPIIFYKFVSM